MKADTNHCRKPAIKFIHKTGKELVEEWSDARNHILILQGNETENPNCKHYIEKPIIDTKDWTESIKWNSKQHLIIKAYSDQETYCTSDVSKILTKTQCRLLIKKIEKCNFNDLDEMILKVNEINTVRLNNEVWENSIFDCKNCKN